MKRNECKEQHSYVFTGAKRRSSLLLVRTTGKQDDDTWLKMFNMPRHCVTEPLSDRTAIINSRFSRSFFIDPDKTWLLHEIEVLSAVLTYDSGLLQWGHRVNCCICADVWKNSQLAPPDFKKLNTTFCFPRCRQRVIFLAIINNTTLSMCYKAGHNCYS